MRILALNPYHGGSHRAFLDGWMAHSRHEFDVLSLPAYKWKWRMRHAAVTFAMQLAGRHGAECGWDVLFCTDMLNLAEFRGLCSLAIRQLPTVAYFHENQLTYPNQRPHERDLHFAFTNVTTALAADRVWFNSEFHRDEFLGAVTDWMRRMPDNQLHDAAESIRRKSAVHPPGVATPASRRPRSAGPPRLVWVSRWEHDKDPETFFAALRLLQQRGYEFRVNVLGESFGQAPACFARARRELAAYIDRWGHLPSRAAYLAGLAESDIVASTARHEFFGIGLVEAVSAGCFPLVPKRLSYPELLGDTGNFFHDGTSVGLADRLGELTEQQQRVGTCWSDETLQCSLRDRFCWKTIAGQMDAAIEELAAART